MVEYIDNSVIAQMSVPDMRLCIQYAVAYPERSNEVIPKLDLFSLSALTFKMPDPETFSLLKCAFEAIKRGGASPAVLNAANEVAVGAFLDGRAEFWQITDSVSEVFDNFTEAKNANALDEIIACDREARRRTAKLLGL